MANLISKLSDKIINMTHGVTSAIILCAGLSTRFSKEGISKQMVNVCGLPVILHTLRSFENAESIGEIILVVKKEDISDYEELVKANGIKKVKHIIPGGATRQESAFLGFKNVAKKAKYVAVHDGARCLVTPDIITEVTKAARRFKAATAASKTTDTVKIADKKGFIKKTIDREVVWNVQTPQIFEKKLYNVSLHYAKANNIAVTDDCMMAESAGFKVKLVNTGKDNIKITYKEDVLLAEQILAARGDSK